MLWKSATHNKQKLPALLHFFLFPHFFFPRLPDFPQRKIKNEKDWNEEDKAAARLIESNFLFSSFSVLFPKTLHKSFNKKKKSHWFFLPWMIFCGLFRLKVTISLFLHNFAESFETRFYLKKEKKLFWNVPFDSAHLDLVAQKTCECLCYKAFDYGDESYVSDFFHDEIWRKKPKMCYMSLHGSMFCY